MSRSTTGRQATRSQVQVRVRDQSWGGGCASGPDAQVLAGERPQVAPHRVQALAQRQQNWGRGLALGY